MNNYNEIRPPPGFEHMFPVVEFPESRDYLVKLDGSDSDADSNSNYDTVSEAIHVDHDTLRNKINLIGESDDETSEGIDENIESGDESNSSKKLKPKSEKVRWNEDINRRKIFVGNVPFNCTQEEFELCFADVPGVFKADIVRGNHDDSRGIGFVTMNSIGDAEDLKARNDIKCKGRSLRFYPYQNNASKNAMESVNNYVYIDGIPADKDREWLKTVFSEYQPFNRYFVALDHNTGQKKSTGFLDLIDDYKYDRLLGSKYHAVITSESQSRAIPMSDSKGKPKRVRDQKVMIPEDALILSTARYRQKTIIRNKNRKSMRKDQLLSAMIIEEHKGHARERSGKRFRR